MSERLRMSRPQPGLAVLTFSGAGRSNIADKRLAVELRQVCEEVNFDSTIRAAIVTGASGRPFCTGLGGGFSISQPIADLNCPVIAAISGDASGIGLEMVLACDFRLASRRAHFSLPYIREGLVPSDGATQRLPRLIGRAAALEMILTGKTISATQACRIGLVNRVVTPEGLMSCALEMAADLAGKAGLALKYCKEAVLKGLDMTLSQGLGLEGDLYFLLHTTANRIEGITAFKEKRKPHFKD